MDTDIYLDNASTSFPKAEGVSDLMRYYLDEVGGNLSRGTTLNHVEDTVYDTREMLVKFFNFTNPHNVVFTQNITYGLNFLIYGLLKENDHCIISSLEHNAVMRPLNFMNQSRQTSYTKVKCDDTGKLCVENLRAALTEKTKICIMNHASNVSGTINPIKEVGNFCRNNGIYFIVDTAQTAGKLDIDADECNIDALAFTGHKGLLGPSGIGGFILKDHIVSAIDPLILGGTGSFSDNEIQPLIMPDKFESGTLNIPGIYGLNAALKYVMRYQKEIFEKEIRLTKNFLDEISNFENIIVIGPRSCEDRVSTVSLDFNGLDNGEVSHKLSKEYGISTRSGLHCAPSAHKALGTFPRGTVRLSFGHKNTEKDVAYALDSIKKIVFRA